MFLKSRVYITNELSWWTFVHFVVRSINTKSQFDWRLGDMHVRWTSKIWEGEWGRAR
jgi:hypothetical protein